MLHIEHAKPLVGLCCCVKRIGDASHPFHAVQEKYITAVARGAGVATVLVPALGAGQVAALVARLDGLVLTGSPSNVEPRHYDGGDSLTPELHDPPRDATTLPLVRAAVEAGVPLLGICRGIQELNVALGGTLHQQLHEVSGRHDHRSDKTKPPEERYNHAHMVRLTPGGLLAELAGATEVSVNSLHAQAIDRVAPSLAVEAVAPDGTVEAVRVIDAPAFALAVQWHPEFGVLEDPLTRALLAAFGDACRARRDMVSACSDSRVGSRSGASPRSSAWSPT